jgi:hypothetical protein
MLFEGLENSAARLVYGRFTALLKSVTEQQN